MATTEDASALADLSSELGYPTTKYESAERFGAILLSNEHAVIVACLDDGSIVGFVHVFIALRIETDAFAELGGFIVAEKYRGRGIGTYLLTAAEKWVVHQGIGKLRVRSRSTRNDAHKFYERLGFSKTKDQYIYDKSIQG